MLLSIQYLRAAAALMVVVFHAAEAWRRLSGDDGGWTFPAGVAGVDVFFVVSGFVMGLTTQGKDPAPLAFMLRRIIRIVPLYWLLTLLVANVAILRPDLLSTTVFDGRHLLASLVFWPAGHPALDETLPLLIPGWTLNYEMAFYALVALSLALPRRLRTGFVLLVLLAAVALREIIPYRSATAFYTMPLILEFGAGLILARAHAGASAVRPWLALFVGAAGAVALLGMAGTGLWRSLAAGLPAALVVAGAVFYERSRPLPDLALPRRLGDASYALYLTHVLVLPVLALVWRQAGLSTTALGGAAYIAAAVCGSALVAIAVHLVLEKPLLALLSGPRGTASPAPNAAPA